MAQKHSATPTHLHMYTLTDTQASTFANIFLHFSLTIFSTLFQTFIFSLRLVFSSQETSYTKMRTIFLSREEKIEILAPFWNSLELFPFKNLILRDTSFFLPQKRLFTIDTINLQGKNLCLHSELKNYVCQGQQRRILDQLVIVLKLTWSLFSCLLS